jgi:hypothetical protein
MLIIDSHNAEINEKKIFNLHLRNSLILKKMFNADLVALPHHLQNKQYEKIVFVHASNYTKSRHFIDFILKQKIEPELWYVCNDYNLGEPTAIWNLCKKYGFKYNVIANHQPEHSKIVTKYVDRWHVCNLNSLIFEPLTPPSFDQVSTFFGTDSDYRTDIVYFGAWRSNREKYFKKYFDRDFAVSTSKKNIKKYQEKGIHALWSSRLNWYGNKGTLFDYKSSLYLEDEKTHEWYSHLANRWYEALSYNIPSFFDRSCMNTIEKAKLNYPDCYIVDSLDELREKIKAGLLNVDLSEQRYAAMNEKYETMEFIKNILC